jgi:hypothetical protein
MNGSWWSLSVDLLPRRTIDLQVCRTDPSTSSAFAAASVGVAATLPPYRGGPGQPRGRGAVEHRHLVPILPQPPRDGIPMTPSPANATRSPMRRPNFLAA